MGVLRHKGIDYSGGNINGLLPHLFITWDEGSTITVSAPNGAIIIPTQVSSTHWECDVAKYGNYIITDGTDSVIVVVDEIKSYNISLKPNGSTVLPINDIQIWLRCANIFDKITYTTLSDILSDSTTLLTLINDTNAVDYMVRSTNWISGICADSMAMNYIGLNNYCSNTLINDTDWLEAICGSEYIDLVLNVKAPKMTSNNTPSGLVGISGANPYPSNYPYYALSGNDETSCSFYKNNRIYYMFTKPVCIKYVKFANIN